MSRVARSASSGGQPALGQLGGVLGAAPRRSPPRNSVVQPRQQRRRRPGRSRAISPARRSASGGWTPASAPPGRAAGGSPGRPRSAPSVGTLLSSASIGRPQRRAGRRRRGPRRTPGSRRPRLAPVSSIARKTNDVPPRLTTSLTSTVVTISRRSRCSAIRSAYRSRSGVGK